ncbi:MAG: hypothetical protein GTO63_07885, partial [Anaerolineae bacterium]|nr:hypothetical protein [Anaerolineae bacterium]
MRACRKSACVRPPGSRKWPFDDKIATFNRLTFSSRRAQLKIYGDSTVFPDYAQSLRKTADGNSAVEFAGRFDNRRV